MIAAIESESQNMKNNIEEEVLVVPMLTVREHCRQIFGNPNPPTHVWEKEFDYNDEELQKLAVRDWREINEHDLYMYYALNLRYVETLQQELFDYLFPICLASWHELIMQDKECALEDEMYKAFNRGYIWNEMMNRQQGDAVKEFVLNTLIEKINLERERVHTAFDLQMTVMRWLYALSNLGATRVSMEPMWQTLWELDHANKAAAALKFVSSFVYQEEGDSFSLYDPYENWSEENVQFLEKNLTVGFILMKTAQLATYLKDMPEGGFAARVSPDAHQNQDVVKTKIEELIANLMSTVSNDVFH